MIVRELNYILNRVPSDGDVKFWVDGPEEHGRFLSVILVLSVAIRIHWRAKKVGSMNKQMQKDLNDIFEGLKRDVNRSLEREMRSIAEEKLQASKHKKEDLKKEDGEESSNDEKAFASRDEFEEYLQEVLCGIDEYRNISDEEFGEILKKKKNRNTMISGKTALSFALGIEVKE